MTTNLETTAAVEDPVAHPGPETAAIQTHALRKVYPASGGRRARGTRGQGAPRPASRGGEPAAPARAGANGGGGDVVALEGLDLEVRQGEFFGLLGPNGAGKTTTIGILTTRVVPSAGVALVSGHDVVRENVAVRRHIGVVPQRPNPDRALTVLENLVFHAAYFGVPWNTGAERAGALLADFDLADRAAAKVDQLSGGQQQRLMIARALIHDPAVLFLDEPTVGLDPHARNALWVMLRRIHAEGRTIVMTTHYMEEADQLCERVAIVDRGQLLALDTPASLKARAPGGTLIELTLDGEAAPVLNGARDLPGILSAEVAGETLRAYGERGGESIAGLIRVAENCGRAVRNVNLHPPSLETLFVSMTGRKFE